MESIGVLDLGDAGSIEIDDLDIGDGSAGTKDDSDINNAIFNMHNRLLKVPPKLQNPRKKKKPLSNIGRPFYKHHFKSQIKSNESIQTIQTG